MNILAENTQPIALSGDKVKCVLRYEAQKHLALQPGNINARTFILHFHNIFGSTRSPNYDIFFDFAGEPHHLGILSFFGAHPKSPENSEGGAQAFRIAGVAGTLMQEVLLAGGELPLLFVSQERQAPGHALIERAYLSCEESR